MTALGVAAVRVFDASDSASTNGAKARVGAADVRRRRRAGGDPAGRSIRSRKQVRTGHMRWAQSADDVAEVADQAVAIAGDAGGQVDGDKRTGGSSPTADLVLRVPPDGLDATVDRIAAWPR